MQVDIIEEGAPVEPLDQHVAPLIEDTDTKSVRVAVVRPALPEPRPVTGAVGLGEVGLHRTPLIVRFWRWFREW